MFALVGRGGRCQSCPHVRAGKAWPEGHRVTGEPCHAKMVASGTEMALDRKIRLHK